MVVEPLRLAPAEEDSVAAEALHTDKLLRPRAGIVGLAWTEASDVAELEELLEVGEDGAVGQSALVRRKLTCVVVGSVE